MPQWHGRWELGWRTLISPCSCSGLHAAVRVLPPTSSVKCLGIQLPAAAVWVPDCSVLRFSCSACVVVVPWSEESALKCMFCALRCYSLCYRKVAGKPVPTSGTRWRGSCGLCAVTLMVITASLYIHWGVIWQLWQHRTVVQQHAILLLQGGESLHWECWWEPGIDWSWWVPASVLVKAAGSAGYSAFGLKPSSAQRAQQEQGDSVVHQDTISLCGIWRLPAFSQELLGSPGWLLLGWRSCWA